MYKRKLTRESLAELAKRMPVLSECQQMAYVGGYDDHDCFWACIAWLQNCGEEYNPETAMEIARGYFGDKFNEDRYAFSGNGHDARAFVSEYFGNLESGSYCGGRILVFDPNKTSGWEGDGSSSHAVIFSGTISRDAKDENGQLLMDENGNPIQEIFYVVIDAKTGEPSEISTSQLPSGSYFVKVP